MKAYRPSDCGDRHDGVRVDRGVTTRLLYVGRKSVGDDDRWINVAGRGRGAGGGRDKVLCEEEKIEK